jgi:hypothetical protein
MRLRTARKICNAIGTPRQAAYRDDQIGAANTRIWQAIRSVSANEYWEVVMAEMTEVERAFRMDRRPGRKARFIHDRPIS